MRPQQAGRAEEGQRDARVGRPETLRVWLLGGFWVSVGTRTVEEGAWRLRKAASLVKLLALAPSHHFHRERAMDLLWPDQGRRAAANNLSQALHAARRALGPDDIQAADSSYLASQGEQLVLCPGGEVWLDVEAFEEAAATARRSREPAAHRAALNLYAGELLPSDPYEEWAEVPREGLRQQFLGLLVELAGLHEERGEYGPGIEALRRLLVEEPTREEAHIGLMRLYALGGRQAEALAQYARLEKFLYRELGMELQASSRALREEIATGRFPPPHRPVGPPKGEIFDPPRHNLPAPRTSFVGRDREIVEVKRALSMTRLLTLTGAGGSGKTRLALEVARDLVDAYPDGAWLVELAELSEGALVPQAVAGAVGVPERPGQPVTDTLGEYLRAKSVLLVLDNCEHVADSVAHLLDTLLDSCPRLKVLTTSREALGLAGEVVWRVPSLSVPDTDRLPTPGEMSRYEAVRLFAERARLRLPAFELTSEVSPAVAEVCRKLEGMPLAIELATARMGTLSVGQISERLEEPLSLLRLGGRTAVARQRTLRATLDWSYELLSEFEQTLFGRLSVFAGGWTLEAAEAVGKGDGIEEGDVLDLLSKLVDKSLVVTQVGGQSVPRYRMLEPVRQYAQERLEESGEAEVVRRAHAEYFLALAEEAEQELIGAREAQWFDRIEEELDNTRAALSWSQERGQTELGLRLAGALREFWMWEGLHSEGPRWIEGALIQEGGTSAVARAKALGALSDLAWGQGDLDRARESAEEGLELGKEAEIQGGRAQFFAWGSPAAFFLNLLARVSSMEGDHERTTKLGEESLALNREVEDAQGTVSALLTLAIDASNQGEYERAEKLYAEGLSLVRELKSARWRFLYLQNWGWTSLLGGDHERAAALTEEAIELARERRRGFLGFLPRALDTLGSAALSGGDLERAEAVLAEGLALAREVGDKDSTSASLEGLACVAGARGEAERAARLFGAAEALREAVGYQHAPEEAALREPYLAAARSQLDEATWEAAWAEGRAMSMEQAVEYALSEEKSTASISLTPQRPSADESPALTRREREVAKLVARRLTNRQIAEELVLSERTVENHVSNILKKLKLYSRSGVAAWVEAL